MRSNSSSLRWRLAVNAICCPSSASTEPAQCGHPGIMLPRVPERNTSLLRVLGPPRPPAAGKQADPSPKHGTASPDGPSARRGSVDGRLRFV